MIELIKADKHCTLSIQNDLFGKVYVHHLVTKKYKYMKGVWSKTYIFDEIKLAKELLFDLESRYRSRGYIYVD